MPLRDTLSDPSLLPLDAEGPGASIAVRDPATGALVGTVPDQGAAETEAAIAAAEAALGPWRQRSAHDRAALLGAWHRTILANVDDLAAIMTAEQGKPLDEARGEIRYSASFVGWYAEEAVRAYGEIIPAADPSARILALRQPVGVCAAITPWNFPSAMITRKVAPALAAGCTIVVKPSDLTPFSALALARLAERAGIPAGVLGMVTGQPRPIGDALCASPVVRKLSFTGSTAVGKHLYAACAGTVKRLSLELGGNAPFLVFDDADLEAAIEGVIASKFRNGGQTCVCANRIYVHDGIFERFAACLSERVGAMRVGDGREPGVVVGPLINEAGRRKVNRHIEDALARGAVPLVGGPGAAASPFVAPTVLASADETMLLASEETFGPVAPLFRFGDEADAVARANGTPFGLASYVYTGSLSRAFRVGEALDFGMVGLNSGSVSAAMAPFGGIKESGIGREGARQGLDEYLETKAIHLGGIRS